MCVCVNVYLYLLVGLLLGHGGRYKAWLAWKDVTIQIQRRNMITYRRDRKQRAFSLGSLRVKALMKQSKLKSSLTLHRHGRCY